jgi:hypothetical protein
VTSKGGPVSVRKTGLRRGRLVYQRGGPVAGQETGLRGRDWSEGHRLVRGNSREE